MPQINVTQSHIDRGQQDSAKSCPIALAFKDHFSEYKDEDQITVSTKYLYCPIPLTEFARIKNLSNYSLSRGIRNWIWYFDSSAGSAPRDKIEEITICTDDDHLYIAGENDDNI